MEQATNEPGAQYPSDDVWRQALNARLHYCSYLHATSNPAERTRLQQSIDGDVESIENVLVTLLKARNNLAHISRLPPELISRIFHYFTSRPDLGLPHRRYRESSEAAPGSPITLSHICHRWRQIVLGDATYWADIPSRVGRRWIEEFIRRSGNLPLRLRIDVPHDFHNTPLDEIRRVVDLSLTGDEAEDTEHLYRRFLNGLTIPAPLLQHFSVDFPVNEASWRAWGYEKRLLLSLPENLFTNNAPALRSVSLYMVDLHWPSSIFGNLEMFEIDWYDRQYSVWTQPDFPTIQQLYDVLIHNPRLRTLKLKRCLPDFATRPAGALAPIHFPHLSDLELLDWAPDCFGVLDLLNVSATCCLKITCTDNHPEYSEDCRELLAWIRNQLERLPSDSGLIVSAALEAYDSRIRIWRCSSDPPPSSQFAFPSEVPLVEIILQYPCMPIDDARFMLTAEQTLHALPITPVVTLSVSTLSMKPTQKEMYRFLLPYSGIKHLQVTVRGGLPERDPKADRISGSFPFLRGQSDPVRRGSSPFLPKLCLLSIGCLEFLLAPPGGAPGEDGVALYDALFWSSRSPQPIETLWVKGCAVSDAEYSALKYLLPDITIHTTELELAIDSQTLWT